MDTYMNQRELGRLAIEIGPRVAKIKRPNKGSGGFDKKIFCQFIVFNVSNILQQPPFRYLQPSPFSNKFYLPFL
jgi:hypothetical protein